MSEINISRQMFEQTHALQDAYQKMLVFELTATPAEKAAKAAERRARLEAEWNAHPGMIGIQDHSDPECGPEYELAERGDYVSRWTTQAKWDRYSQARDAFRDAADEL